VGFLNFEPIVKYVRNTPFGKWKKITPDKGSRYKRYVRILGAYVKHFWQRREQ
jgi:hypothetical protein